MNKLEIDDTEIDNFCSFAKLVSKDKYKIHDYQKNVLEEIDKAIKEGRRVNISIASGWQERLNRVCNYELLAKCKGDL